jgi:hypothetical protein
VRAHLRADLAYQRRLVRFLENHDEPRAAATMPRDKEQAAAVLVATLPAAVLWHEGQFEGRRVRPPVFLARRPDEPTDHGLHDFYCRLLAAVRSTDMRSGQWRLLDRTGWPDNRRIAICSPGVGRMATGGISPSSTSPTIPPRVTGRCPGPSCVAAAGG